MREIPRAGGTRKPIKAHFGSATLDQQVCVSVVGYVTRPD